MPILGRTLGKQGHQLDEVGSLGVRQQVKSPEHGLIECQGLIRAPGGGFFQVSDLNIWIAMGRHDLFRASIRRFDPNGWEKSGPGPANCGSRRGSGVTGPSIVQGLRRKLGSRNPDRAASIPAQRISQKEARSAERIGAVPTRPDPAGSEIRTRFKRGRAQPRGVAWFGVRSFWGHLRHFVAAAIATEDIDSRDWMTPDDPEELADSVIQVLGGRTGARTVIGALGRDLWIDYISDTGDDVSVSAAVAKTIFADYALDDPDRPGETLLAPRGEILLFGGDTAYPVATAQEITNRVLVPFNRALEALDDRRPRVLLGIPGNHDWYDGLDGFGRMFHRRTIHDQEPRPSMVGISSRMLERYAEWARQFVRGGKVEKPKNLALSGYTPLQNASYFVLPLSDSLHLFAADRQLKTLDSRQRQFLSGWYQQHPEAGAWLLFPDPVFRFGSPSPTGTEMVRALGIDFGARSHFFLSGDVHHYERRWDENVLHVIAGGGGAFLHPAPMIESKKPADVRWPSAGQCKRLLFAVPWKVARGRSGFLPHWVFSALFGPLMATGVSQESMTWLLACAVLFLVAVVYTLIGGVRRKVRKVAVLAGACACATVALPVGLSYLVRTSSLMAPDGLLFAASLGAAVFAGAFLFGFYLVLLTRLGLEHTQAFTALDHPGFKHFVRLRVRADGRTVDGWCLGRADPLNPSEPVVVVDNFQWRA